jgi:uncharacterized protein YndB with AHSA1/START domain
METTPQQPEVTRSVELDADVDEVWRCLTDDDERSAWFGGDTRIDVRPGGAGRVVDPDGTHRSVQVDRVEPGRRLGWRWWRDDDGEASDVEFVLEPVGPATRLVVTERRTAVVGDVSACLTGGVASRLPDLELLLLTRVRV